jgi:hypothetical protein
MQAAEQNISFFRKRGGLVEERKRKAVSEDAGKTGQMFR